MRVACPLLALVGLMVADGAAAQSVVLSGMLGKQALLVVDGGPPRSVAPGQTVAGVTVIATQGDQAVVEIQGQRHTLRVGDTPARQGAGIQSSNGRRIVLPAGSGGHFTTPGRINGQATQFLVDTGATVVSLGQADADRLGLDTKTGTPVRIGTANGTVAGWRIRLDSVRIGEVEVYGVDAVVLAQPMPYVLLGNSYLNRFQMQRSNDQMVLDRRD